MDARTRTIDSASFGPTEVQRTYVESSQLEHWRGVVEVLDEVRPVGVVGGQGHKGSGSDIDDQRVL